MNNKNSTNPRATREDLAVKIGDLQPSTIWTAEADKLVDSDPDTGIVFVKTECVAAARAYIRENQWK